MKLDAGRTTLKTLERGETMAGPHLVTMMSSCGEQLREKKKERKTWQRVLQKMATTSFVAGS